MYHPDMYVDWSEVVPSEWKVIRLVVLGYSNRAIAKKLGLEVTTIERHITHVLSKLGISLDHNDITYSPRTALCWLSYRDGYTDKLTKEVNNVKQ